MPCLVVGDAGLVEIEAVDRRRAARRDQQVRAFDAVAAFEHGRDPAGRTLDRAIRASSQQVDAFAAQARDDDGGQFGIVLGETGRALPAR